MNDLKIYCEDSDFSPLAAAFSGEFESDCTLSAEIIIVDEDEIRRLNREQRDNDSVTDVLSFPSLEGVLGKPLSKNNFPCDIDEEGNLFIGSIAICLKRAEEQAEEYGHSINRELNYLAAHGVCHLLGYDHMEESDKKAMREKEERVLKKINATRDSE
ncbi:MAG: rRNA maturation RNase YbeY [Clostridia bacterium]|nr:rRNA maturation RNase YbeY [Clostridia bacterium]